jgi:hypothetical protein
MKKTTLAIVASGILLFTGCETLEKLCGFDVDDLGFTEDYTQQLNAAIYIYQQTDRAMRDSTLKAQNTAVIDGADVTLTPDSVIIDYGNGSIGADGKIRTGSIRIGYQGDYLIPGSEASLKLLNYEESDLRYEANLHVSNTTSGSGTPHYDVDLISFKLDSLELIGNLNVEWQAGFETQAMFDDDFQLAGAATLTNINSNDNFVGTILMPLLISTGCDFSFVSGEFELIPSNPALPASAKVNFIDGDCANLFEATIDCEGSPLKFTLPIQ